jgi:hypothetical protein
VVLVDSSSGIIGSLYPVQGQIYEMVEQAPAGKEEGAVWEVGG